MNGIARGVLGARMDWDLCKTFVAVAETRSFAAAARRLRSSHPTVGRSIAALEDQLGTKLFARSNEGLSLTAQGRKFREHVEAMSAAALRAEAAVSAGGPAGSGVEQMVSQGPPATGLVGEAVGGGVGVSGGTQTAG